MLSLAQSQTSPTILKAVVLMNFAAWQVFVKVKAPTSELFGITLIPWTGRRAVTSNIMQSFAGEETPSLKPWMQRLTSSRLTKLLEGFRMAQSQQNLSTKGKEKYHTHIANTPKWRPSKRDGVFRVIHPDNVLIGPRLFTGYLKACTHSALLRTKDFAAA